MIMPFQRNKSRCTTELYLKDDVAHLLDALEIDNPRSGYELGFMEALTRIAKSFGLQHDPAPAERSYFLLETSEQQARRSR